MLTLSLAERAVFTLVLAGSVAYFALRTATLVQLVRLGKPDADQRIVNLRAGVLSALLDVFTQRRVFRKPWVGLFHVLIVWGFLVFAINTMNHFLGAYSPGFHLFGGGALARAYNMFADVFAVLILVGVIGLAVRRYVFKPENLTPRSVESAIVFLFIGGAMVAYLLAHSTAIAVGAVAHPNAYPVSAAVSAAFAGMPEWPRLLLAHFAWWAGAIMHLVLVALLVIPTKHLHLVAGPINLAFPPTRARGHMAKIDIENEAAESFGVSKLEEFSWKQNLDLFACIECGRCQDFCPTHNSGKTLKPKYLIVDMKHHLLADGRKLLARNEGDMPSALHRLRERARMLFPWAFGEDSPQRALIGEVVHVDAIWACTTCMACVEHCPMGIEHVDKITDMRRHLTLMEAATPEPAATSFRNMENAGNPWGFAQSERGAWADGLGAPVFVEKQEAEVLFWVGCSGSYDDRSKAISRAMVRILKAVGIDFAILGAEERCTCESARRLGNEYLYQMATQEIVETLRKYKFKYILTTCPHCFNTIKNEYPDFGADYTVIHHTQLIAEMVATGRLRLKPGAAQRIAFHDSCYLGRYNGEFDGPRHAIEAAGGSLVSVPREREHGFCCGAGGGRMWLEETQGEMINTVRARELLDTQPEKIAASCPFCMTMLSDGVKKLAGEKVAVFDVAELVAEALVEAPAVATFAQGRCTS